MPVSIDVPSHPYSFIKTNLSGFAYELIITENSRSGRLSMAIVSNNEIIIRNVTLIEGGEALLQNYRLPGFDHGDLFCVRINKTKDPIKLGNIGVGKDYELVYMTNEELGLV